MKKLVLFFVALSFISFVHAQDDLYRAHDEFPAEDTAKACCMSCCMAMTAPWVIDLNLLGGGSSQSLTNVNMANTYTNSLNNNISNLKFTKGSSFGFDAQIGYFFGQHKHWGVGTGIMLMKEYGTLGMDQFHTEYQSTDYEGATFRQLLTADGGIKEKLNITNVNIPLVLKYKTQFDEKWGFTADAGMLFNVSIKNSYNSSAAFDYEAIYDFNESNVPIYDNSPTPNPNDWLITKSQYLAKNPNGDVNAYFQAKQNEGYNVGLNVTPHNNTGSVSYTTGSVGLLLQPSVSYMLCEQFALNFGLYYIYQTFNNSANNNYRITDKVGQYSSLLNSVSTSNNSAYGVNVGIRFFFGKSCCDKKPKEEPKIEEIKEEPKEEPKEVEQPKEVTPPPTPTVEQPKEEPKEQPQEENEDADREVIRFETGKAIIKKATYHVIDEMVKSLKDNPQADVEIDGFTDITGGDKINNKLSQARALSVKKYLMKKGIAAKRIHTKGFGSKHPVASNKTAKGRAKNRRAVLKMKYSMKYSDND